MSGDRRDLAAWGLWEASLARSRERRQRAAQGQRPAGRLLDPPGASPRDLAHSEPWELSAARSLARRQAADLQFVPTGTRARRVSIATLAALSAGPGGRLASATAEAGPSASSAIQPSAGAGHLAVATTGSRGPQVTAVQRAVGAAPDGVYGERTATAVRAFQARHGLVVDNVVGPRTRGALGLAGGGASNGRATHSDRHRAEHRLSSGQRPSGSHRSSRRAGRAATAAVSTGRSTRAALHSRPVEALQRSVGVPADGVFGAGTRAAVRAVQARHGLRADGIVGPATWRALHLSGHAQTLGRAARASVFRPSRHSSSRVARSRSRASHTRSRASSASASVASAGARVQRVIEAGNRIARLPYRYGGGHGSFQDRGYDCSGSVSYALHGAGLIRRPMDSSELEHYGRSGPGRHITIYANSGHAYLVVDGRRFDTSGQRISGSRWTKIKRPSSGYVVRHPAGL